MNSFLERLTLAIHWIGFLISLLSIFAYFMYGVDFNNYEWVGAFVMILIPNTIGWFIKWLFTGNSNYFPFKLED